MSDSVAPGDITALIQRIATGPKLSKDLARDEARAGMRAVLAGSVHPVQAAIFLIALRMKRETDDENLGLMDALVDAAPRVAVDVPQLVDVSDPYDGFSRSLPVTPFLPCVLAACGMPAYAHGVERMAPKFGLSHARVLRAAGVPVTGSSREAAERLADPSCGWGYLDQSAYCPALYAAQELRTLMIKRTALSTLERVLAPLRAREHSHLLTGYVHVAYPPTYAMLARAAGYASALIVRGTEGAVVPSLRQRGQAWAFHGSSALQHLEFEPEEAGIVQALRAVPAPESMQREQDDGAAIAAETGLAALDGAQGAARDALVYAAALCLRHLGLAPDLAAAAARVRERIDAGDARARFEAARG